MKVCLLITNGMDEIDRICVVMSRERKKNINFICHKGRKTEEEPDQLRVDKLFFLVS